MKSELVGLLRGSAVAHEELARPQGVGNLDGQRQWNRRLSRRQFKHPRQWLGAQSRQARPEEAQEPSWGPAKGALWPCCGTATVALASKQWLPRLG